MNLLTNYVSLLFLKDNILQGSITQKFLYKCLGVYLLSGMIFITLISGDIVSSFLEIILNLFILVIILSGLIVVKKALSSFYRLLATVIVCENFFLLMDIGTEVMEYFLETTPYQHYVLIAGLLLFLWNFLVIANILKNTLNFSKLSAVALCILYFSATDGIPLLLLS